MREKIVELQGLRCIAIISVLLFHIWPETFGNGFLGVDIFFVVSGYIMAMILLSSNSIKESFFTTALKFYYRRIYRILPLYLFNIFFTLLIVPIASYTYVLSDFWSQTKSALTFTTNFAMYFEKHNYFNNQGLQFYWYKHYWSLCVEMQFYAIVPFLLYLSKRLPLLVSLFLLWPLMIGGCVFLIFYMLINYGSNGAQFTFTMLPARIYEFIGGFVAFNLQQAIDQYFNDNNNFILLAFKKSINSVITVNILTLLLIILSLFPIKLIDVYTLPATVILTAALITSIGRSKEKKKEMRYSILANKFCIFVGDASYSLYICHWIIVFLGKLLYGDDNHHRQLILISCVIFGVIVHLCIEKPIVKARLKPEAFFPWLIAAYMVIGYVAYTVEYQPPSSISSSLIKDIYHNKSQFIFNETQWRQVSSTINPRLAADLAIYTTKIGFNHFPQSAYAASFNSLQQHSNIEGTELKGNGSLSFLVIGNSHALCFFHAAILALDGLYSELNLLVAGNATPFEGFVYSRTGHLLKDGVIHYKPDVIFFVFKYQSDMELPPTEPIEKDFGTIKIQEMIDFLSNHSKVLLISDIHFEALKFNALIFAEAMHRYGFVGDYGFSQSDLENRHITSTRRWKVIKCKRCIFMNFLQAYCKDRWCSPVDATGKVPLVFDDNHLTAFGSSLLIPFLKGYVEKMNEILKLY